VIAQPNNWIYLPTPIAGFPYTHSYRSYQLGVPAARVHAQCTDHTAQGLCTSVLRRAAHGGQPHLAQRSRDAAAVQLHRAW